MAVLAGRRGFDAAGSTNIALGAGLSVLISWLRSQTYTP